MFIFLTIFKYIYSQRVSVFGEACRVGAPMPQMEGVKRQKQSRHKIDISLSVTVTTTKRQEEEEKKNHNLHVFCVERNKRLKKRTRCKGPTCKVSSCATCQQFKPEPALQFSLLNAQYAVNLAFVAWQKFLIKQPPPTTTTATKHAPLSCPPMSYLPLLDYLHNTMCLSAFALQSPRWCSGGDQMVLWWCCIGALGAAADINADIN